MRVLEIHGAAWVSSEDETPLKHPPIKHPPNPNKKGRRFLSSPYVMSIYRLLHRAVAGFADRFNIFADALNGVAGGCQQRC